MDQAKMMGFLSTNMNGFRYVYCLIASRAESTASCGWNSTSSGLVLVFATTKSP